MRGGDSFRLIDDLLFVFQCQHLAAAISPPFAPPISASGASAPQCRFPHRATNEAEDLETT
jgi:hypothetical protein